MDIQLSDTQAIIQLSSTWTPAQWLAVGMLGSVALVAGVWLLREFLRFLLRLATGCAFFVLTASFLSPHMNEILGDIVEPKFVLGFLARVLNAAGQAMI